MIFKKIKINYLSQKIDPNSNKGIEQSNSDLKTLNEKYVLIYVLSQENKSDERDTIGQEYTEKVVLYGYVMLFACSFSLGPLILLAINLFDMRIDAQRLLWLYRRPVGYRAQDIGFTFFF